jgi:DHA1 family inner membrane transport protein
LFIRDRPGRAPAAGAGRLWTRPAIALNLLAVFAWQLAMFVPFTFLAEILAVVVGLDATGISALLLVYGAAAFLGNRSGGRAADQRGGTTTVLLMLSGLLVALVALAGLPQLPSGARLQVAVAALALWGWTGWGVVPAQMSRLVRLAPAAAQPVLSLNTAVIYWGIAAGAWVGGVALNRSGLESLGWVAVTMIAAVLALLALQTWAGTRPVARRPRGRLSAEPAEEAVR